MIGAAGRNLNILSGAWFVDYFMTQLAASLSCEAQDNNILHSYFAK